VVDRLHERYSSNGMAGISLPEIISNSEIELLESAISHFGTWENTLAQSGFDAGTIEKVRRKDSELWSQEAISDQIRILQNFRFDLSVRFIRHIYPELYQEAKKKMNYSGWLNALEGNEIESEHVRLPMRTFWKLPKIIDTLSDYFLVYGNLQPEFIRNLNPSLYHCSRRYYKTWQQTVSALGLNLSKNLYMIMLEPIRIEALQVYVIQTLELLKKNSIKIIEFEGSTIESRSIFKSYIEFIDDNTQRCALISYRSWAGGLEKMIWRLLEKYEQVEVYYSIGEPRVWLNSNVKFINTEEFYPELMRLGRDDIISALGLFARGGVPNEFKDKIDQIWSEYKRITKLEQKEE
jgi:hypothetical protein